MIVILYELSHLFVVSAICSLISLIFAYSLQKSTHGLPILFLIIFSISTIGSIVGFISGLSRVGVAGQVITAVLVFFGAGVAYIYNLDKLKKAFISSLVILSFSTSMIMEYYYSTLIRTKSETENNILENQQNEINIVREHCLKFILSDNYFKLNKKEKLRIRIYCKPYVSFLR